MVVSKFQLKVLLQFLAITMLAFFISKLSFILLNPPPVDYGFFDLIHAWATGLRFELSSFFILNAIGILLLFCSHYHWMIFKLSRLWLICALISGSWVTLADVFYYQHVNHKIGMEVVHLFTQPLTIFSMVLKGYPLVLFALIFSAALIFYILTRLTPKEIPELLRNKGLKTGWLALLYVFIILFSIVTIRGGFQLRPLTVINGYTGNHPYWGDFAIPGIYTSLAQTFTPKKTFIPDENFREKREDFASMLADSREIFINPKYPFLRKQPAGAAGQRNVFLISMESWSTAEIGFFGNTQGNTSYFDELQKQGLLFSNFYANGTRSIVAPPAIAGSLLQVFGEPFTMSDHQTARHVSLASVFNNLDYHTFFITGSKKGTMNFVDYAALTGFQTITHESTYPAGEMLRDGAWGVYDHVLVDDFLDRLKRHDQGPVFAYFIFIHPHGPYKVPNEFHHYTPDTPRYQYLNALRYSDAILKKLVEGLRELSYWDNSIFILTADHPFEQPSGIASFHVPLLIVAPGLVKPGVDSTLGSHIDIMPSLIDLLNVSENHSSMGKSLFASFDKRRVTLDFDNYLGYADENFLITWNKEKVMGLYAYQQDPRLTKNLKDQKPNLAMQLGSELKLYLSFVNYAKANNKIAP